MSLSVPGSLCWLALVASVMGCAQQEDETREASLGVERSPDEERGTRPREEPAGSGEVPRDEHLNVQQPAQPPNDVLWTPKPQAREAE
ncbi:MAG: hypothetical protein H5U40_03910 [Polyangiaceae bacterium]|nr:hypothetical protein [Polyangiaceae bacterium]